MPADDHPIDPLTGFVSLSALDKMTSFKTYSDDQTSYGYGNDQQSGTHISQGYTSSMTGRSQSFAPPDGFGTSLEGHTTTVDSSNLNLLAKPSTTQQSSVEIPQPSHRKRNSGQVPAGRDPLNRGPNIDRLACIYCIKK